MIEIRIHGRGGQGNVVAAYLLATAAFEEGRHCQAFPNFGAERRGAPVVAFVRISAKPIKRRCQVLEPSFLIIQDSGLLHIPSVTEGLIKGGGVLVNSLQSSEEISEELKFPAVALPASLLAQQVIGRPMPNVALLAAFLSATSMLPLSALSKALTQRFKGDVLERNLKLIDEAAAMVPAGLWKGISHAAST
jgi:pyruvate ferredoxin oxidoreductase gamma subunit